MIFAGENLLFLGFEAFHFRQDPKQNLSALLNGGLGDIFRHRFLCRFWKIYHRLRFSHRGILVRFDVLMTLPIEVAQDLLRFHIKFLEPGIDPGVGMHTGQDIKLMLDPAAPAFRCKGRVCLGIGLLRNDYHPYRSSSLLEDLGPSPDRA